MAPTEHDALGPAAAQGRRNAFVLAVCQGLYTCAISIDLTQTGLTGYQLAPLPILATLPFALITVSGAVATLFASFLLHRIGRRAGFSLGALAGATGGLVAVWAVFHHQFWTFCLGTILSGVYQAFAQYYRLAAADAVEDEAKGRAISAVLTGGVIAALIGPALAAWSKDLFPVAMFAGAYLVAAMLGVATILLLFALYRDEPMHQAGPVETDAPPRPLAVIARMPIFIAAAVNSVAGYVTMMFVMTAAPLAAVACHHTVGDGAQIMQWHLVGMYAPSFFAGRLIDRLGMPAVLLAGIGLTAACVGIAVSSTTVWAFTIALLCLGVGWNFMFVGGSTLLARACEPSERAKTQGTSEFIRFGATALAVLGAGPMLDGLGWAELNLLVLPVLVPAVIATLWWVIAERRATAEAGAAA